MNFDREQTAYQVDTYFGEERWAQDGEEHVAVEFWAGEVFDIRTSWNLDTGMQTTMVTLDGVKVGEMQWLF